MTNKTTTPSPLLVVELDHRVSRHLEERRKTKGSVGRGWMRCKAPDIGAMIWRMWVPKDGQIYAYSITISLMELRDAGRISAALALRRARHEITAVMAANV